MPENYTVFARQAEAVGLYGVCSEPSRDDDNSNVGQFGRWEHGVNFGTTTQLSAELRALHQPIVKLGLSCHGSINGNNPATFGGIALNGFNGTWLRVDNLSAFQTFINDINSLVMQNGTVFFFACNVASSDPGRSLLMELSTRWPTRRVVGFAAEGMQPGHQWIPGAHCEEPGVQFDGRWGDDNIPGATIARAGLIIRG